MKGKGGGIGCPVVHFNLLIRGSKGGLVGHNLVQSDCPAKGDKGESCNVPQNMGALFLNSCHVWSNALFVCMHPGLISSCWKSDIVKCTQYYTDFIFSYSGNMARDIF